jgi:hypothetical protein
MRTLMVTAFVSLDGVVQAPGGPDEDRDGGFTHGGWAAPYIDDEVIARATGFAVRADALLLGRRTRSSPPPGRWPRPTTRSARGGRPCGSTSRPGPSRR